MGCVGVQHAEGKMEEELPLLEWSLCGAQQGPESYICMSSDDTDLAPLLSSFQLCFLSFFLPNSELMVCGMACTSLFCQALGSNL